MPKADFEVGPRRSCDAPPSLITTAKLNDIDPQAWLADTLARIAHIPQARLADLLPWNWRATEDQRQAADLRPSPNASCLPAVHRPLERTDMLQCKASGLSPLRQRLASFEHAYCVALRLRAQTGKPQFIVQTGDPMQPFRTASRPCGTEAVRAVVA